MIKKQSGFTLIEVLVTILISTLVLAMVAGTMTFLITTIGDMIREAKEIDTAKNIEKYLKVMAEQNKDLEMITLDSETQDIKNNDDVVFADTNLLFFKIFNENQFTKCYLEFEDGKCFEFIIQTVSAEDKIYESK